MRQVTSAPPPLPRLVLGERGRAPSGNTMDAAQPTPLMRIFTFVCLAGSLMATDSTSSSQHLHMLEKCLKRAQAKYSSTTVHC